MTVKEMLDMLSEEFEAAKKGLFTSKHLVDADKCLDLVDDIKDTLPIELERAANIMKERRQILVDAENEAQQYLDEAQKKASEMVKESEIYKKAEQEAANIVNNAKQNAKEIRLGAKAYAKELLQELEKYLLRYAEQVKQSRDQFEK